MTIKYNIQIFDIAQKHNYGFVILNCIVQYTILPIIFVL